MEGKIFMKKYTFILTVVLALTFILSACSGQNNSKPNSETSEATFKTTTEAASKDVELVDSGYTISKDGEYVNWGAIIKNPDDKAIYEFTKIIITAYDKEGGVVATEDQVMNVIAPGETQAFGSILDTNGEVPDKVEFSIESGDKITASEKHISSSEFEIIGAKDRKDEYGETAFTGKVKNNSTKDCSSAGISIILKKENKIVYGTTSYVDDINAGQEKAFDISEYDLPDYDSYEIIVIDWT
jgi:hypothetical protein